MAKMPVLLIPVVVSPGATHFTRSVHSHCAQRITHDFTSDGATDIVLLDPSLLATLTTMQNEPEKDDYVTQTIATYNVIAPDYKLTATSEVRAWEENSMRRFSGYLAGKRVLLPGCGDGRDSRFLRSLGLAITSFDLSEEMLKTATAQDPQGTYFRMDLREMDQCAGTYDGIFASGCLYHPQQAGLFKMCSILLGTAFKRGCFLSQYERGSWRAF